MTDSNIAFLAYYAGIFDGEGTVTLHLSKSGCLTRTLQITNTHYGILEAAMERWGGSTYERKPRIEGRKLVLYWQICGSKSECFAREILPFATIKTAQLKLYLEAGRLMASRRGEPRIRLTPEQREERRAIADESRRLKAVA